MINYYLITKPGIILGNLITVGAGFLLASKTAVNPLLFLETLLGIAFIIASACVFNNMIDVKNDQKMERTKKRPLAAGLITEKNAFYYGSLLGVLGLITLFIFTNMLTVFLAFLGFFVYVVLYSYWKVHTVYGTAIGSIAGATPPVIGYTAVANRFDEGAFILFAMMLLWQMPHFYAISLMYLKDYTKANIPLLPIEKGILRTKVHMTLYTLIFIPVAMMLTFFNYTGPLYLVCAFLLGVFWFILSLKGYYTDNTQAYGKQMFRFSLILITLLCILIPLDSVV